MIEVFKGCRDIEANKGCVLHMSGTLIQGNARMMRIRLQARRESWQRNPNVSRKGIIRATMRLGDAIMERTP